MDVVGRVANAMAGSAGKTQGEMILDVMRAMYPADHPEVAFAEWMVENSSRIQEACQELGVEPPEPGPNLFSRLKFVVLPALEQR